MGGNGNVEVFRERLLEELAHKRVELAQNRLLVMRQASSAWLDLAVGYAKNSHLEAICVTRNDGSKVSVEELHDILRSLSDEEARLAQRLSECEADIALATQGAVHRVRAWERAQPDRVGKNWLGVLVGKIWNAFERVLSPAVAQSAPRSQRI